MDTLNAAFYAINNIFEPQIVSVCDVIVASSHQLQFSTDDSITPIQHIEQIHQQYEVALRIYEHCNMIILNINKLLNTYGPNDTFEFDFMHIINILHKIENINKMMFEIHTCVNNCPTINDVEIVQMCNNINEEL